MPKSGDFGYGSTESALCFQRWGQEKGNWMASVIRVWAAVVAVVVLVAVVAAQEPLADPIETPHVKWAKPTRAAR